MRITLSFVMLGIALLILGVSQPSEGRAQDLNSPGAAAKGIFPQTDRSLSIEGADASLADARISGPVFAASALFVGAEDVLAPAALRLRNEYRLDDVVSGETNEFQRMLLLRNWVHSRWHIDNEQNFNGDVFSILEKAKAGEGFNCSQAMKVQHAALAAMGYVVRDLGVQCNTEEFPDAFHHGVNEVWSNEYAKWVLMDSEYDFHFEREGLPLSALEVHEAVRKGNGRDIVKVQGPRRTVVPMQGPGFPFTAASGYWWVSYHVQLDPFTGPKRKESRLVIFDNEAFQQTTWMRKRGDNVLRKHWAYDAKAFVPTKERRQIEWTPGVPEMNVRQVAAAELQVRVSSVTPNFKSTNIRVSGGPWQAQIDGRFAWKLREGTNRLEVRTQNVLNVDGPIVTALVTLKPKVSGR